MNWKELVKYSSVQLRKHESRDSIPIGFGSACLIDFKGHRLLVTVFHVTERSSSWAAQIKYNNRFGKIEALFLNQFTYLANFSKIDDSIEAVEFSFHPVKTDFKCYYHNWNYKGETIEIVERPVFTIDDIEEPQMDMYYGFSGDIKPVSIPDLNAFETTQHIYGGLKFSRFENDMYYFTLPEPHPGHKMFEGCSGAPIIGENGKIVSLVSGGSTKTNEIYGCNLSKCIRTLDSFFE